MIPQQAAPARSKVGSSHWARKGSIKSNNRKLSVIIHMDIYLARCLSFEGRSEESEIS